MILPPLFTLLAGLLWIMNNLLLLSGGIDSACLAAWLKPEGCLTINYGQMAAKAEVMAAAEICKDLGQTHYAINANVSSLGMGIMAGITQTPSEYPDFWPFRNQYLITLGAMFAIKNGFKKILIGTVATDHFHRDGTNKFLELMRELLLFQEGSIEIEAPAARLSTSELIKISGIPQGTLAWTHSCHVSNLACGVCPGCKKHSTIMSKLGWNR